MSGERANIGNISSPTISAAGGTRLTIRGSGFQAGSHRRQVRNGNIGRYEYTDCDFARAAGRPSAATANERERRNCVGGCFGGRQLVSNFSRRASSKLTTTLTY